MEFLKMMHGIFKNDAFLFVPFEKHLCSYHSTPVTQTGTVTMKNSVDPEEMLQMEQILTF